MKKHQIILFLIIQACLVTGCMEEVVVEQNQFIKIVGLEGSSIAKKLIELENGDIMILGKMGIPAHEIESTGTGIDIKEVEDQAPFIAVTDANGNMKNLRLYPIEDIQGKWVDPITLGNFISFENIIPLNTGGYAVLAEARGFDITIAFPGTPEIIDNSSPEDTNVTHFLLKLDAQFNIDEIRSFNANSDWNGQYFRIYAKMKAISDEEIGVLLNRKIDVTTGRSVGYSFIRFDHQLDTLEFVESFDEAPDKFSYDFDVNQDNLIGVLGNSNANLTVFGHPLSDLTNVSSEFVSPEGTFDSRNTNQHYVESLVSNEFCLVYTQPSTEVRAEIRGSSLEFVRNFVVGDPSQFPFVIRAPRAVYEMRNGDILVYVINIPPTDESIQGYLYRYTPTGQMIFEQPIDGSPGDVIELDDGNILVATNKEYNGLLQRISLIKLNANGELN